MKVMRLASLVLGLVVLGGSVNAAAGTWVLPDPPPVLKSSKSRVHLALSSYYACGPKGCEIADFFSDLPPPRAEARLGETVTFALPIKRDWVTIEFKGRDPVKLGTSRIVTWRVTAAGTYPVGLSVRTSTQTTRTDWHYGVILRVKRP